jgi:exo-beta-1,3-glucanase (GH17 family)
VDDAALLVDLMEKTMEMVIENLGAVEVVDTVMVGLDMLMEVDLMDDDLVDKVAHKNILKIYLI